MSVKPNEQAIAGRGSLDPVVRRVEAGLCCINNAEGYLLVGNIAHGMRLLAIGKSILEEIIETEPVETPNKQICDS